MGKVWLARHGETEWSVPELRYAGHTDVALSEHGHRQAEALAGRLQERPIAAIHTSDLRRAVETAEPLAKRIGLEMTASPELREQDYGKWEGLTVEEIEARYPGEMAKWDAHPAEYAPPGGESREQLQGRVLPTFLSLCEQHREQEIAMVVHKGAIRAILCHLLGVPLTTFPRIAQDCAAINVIGLSPRRTVVQAVNDCCHLEGLIKREA